MKLKFWVLSCGLIFCFMDSFSHFPSQKWWWQVEMEIEVKGNYKFGNKTDGFMGDFSFKMYLLECMERDNGDYILYRGKSEILGLEWKEIIYKGKKISKELILSKKVNPEFMLNYVMRGNGKISFDLEISPVTVPDEGFDNKRSLFLPRSAKNQNIHGEDKYNSGVTKGSNKVIVDDLSIYKDEEVVKVFKWNWKRKGFQWINSHSVELRLMISRIEI